VEVIHVWNKADVASSALVESGIPISAKTGSGLDGLRRVLLAAAGWQAPAGSVFIARERHLQALRRVELHLDGAFRHLMDAGLSLELVAEELRLSQSALSEITGEFTPDDLLGVIFTKFCIGK
jgi:tRNA modification GTPase